MTRERARAWYRFLVGRYPRAFRDRFCVSMEQTFGDLLRERREAGRPVAGLVARVFIETCGEILKEHARSIAMGTLIRQPSIWLPMAISLSALGLVMGYALMVGVSAPQPGQDEGTPARIFQLLIALQAVLIVVFAARRVRRTPREAAVIVAGQLLVAVIPIAAVVLLESAS